MSLDEFHASLNDFKNYPENLLSPGVGVCRSVLRSFKERLDVAALDLCLVGDDEISRDFEIPIRDMDTASGNGKKFQTGLMNLLLRNC